jgi:hypothetical protein
MYQQLWGYKVEEKLYLGVREQKGLNTTGLDSKHYQAGRRERVYNVLSILSFKGLKRFLTVT